MTAETAERSYEGEVREADGSLMSIQCFEGRHGDCPEGPEGHLSDEGAHSLRGYSCECPCDGEGDDRPLTELLRACKEIEDCSGGWNGGDVVSIVCELLTKHGYDINAPLDDDEEDDGNWPEACAACGAEVGEECRPGCVGRAADADEEEK